MINKELMNLLCESMLFVKKIIEEEEPGEKKIEHIKGYLAITQKLINKISEEELIPISKQIIQQPIIPTIQVAGNYSFTDSDRGTDQETEILEIDTTSETYNVPQKGGDIESDSLMNYLKNDTKSDTLLDNLKEEELVVEMEAAPKSILKKITINEDNNTFDEIIGGAPITPISKKDKIKNKLKTTPAENVQRIGKELGFKPPAGKKTMTKTYVTEKILSNPKLYDKAYKVIRKHSYIKSDTASDY